MFEVQISCLNRTRYQNEAGPKVNQQTVTETEFNVQISTQLVYFD